MRGSRVVAAVAIGVAVAFAIVACSSFEEEAPVDTSPESGGETPRGSDGGDGGADAIVDGAVVEGSSDSDLGDDAAVTLASGLGGLVGVAVSSDSVFVAKGDDGTVRRLPILGGDGGTTTILSGLNGLSNIAVVGSYVVYSTSQGQLGRADFVGMSTQNASIGPIKGLVRNDASSVFGIKVNASNNDVRKYDINLNSGEGYGGVEPASDVAVFGSTVYWTTEATGAITIGSTGGTPAATTFKSSEVGCGSIAADAVGAYWTTASAVRGKASGDAGATTLANERAVAIAANAGAVYWLTAAPPGRLRRGKMDAPAVTLASGFVANFTPSQKVIALTAQYVIWITSDGRVMRHDR